MLGRSGTFTQCAQEQPLKVGKTVGWLTQSVLGYKVVDHIPLPAVRQRCLKQRLDEPRVEVQVGCVDDLLEKEVGLLQLVPVQSFSLSITDVSYKRHPNLPKEQVCLAQLKRLEVVLLHERNPKHIRRSK